MISSIKDYLKQLDKALKGSDRAVIQDAIADAEEYLNNAMAEVKLKNPGINEEAAIPGILDTYGTPVEVAAAYRKAEFETSTNIKIADNTSNFMETDNEAPIALQPKNIAPGKWYYLFFKIIGIFTVPVSEPSFGNNIFYMGGDRFFTILRAACLNYRNTIFFPVYSFIKGAGFN
jgi:hypothetical protein